MELFQDLLFTISLSLLVSLLLAKLFSAAASSDCSVAPAFEEAKEKELAAVCDFEEIDNVAVVGESEVVELTEPETDVEFCDEGGERNCEKGERESVGVTTSRIEITPSFVETNEKRSSFCEIEVEAVKDGVDEEDDDWEGIERTELEKEFWAAVAFLGSKSNAGRVGLISNEVKMQFYGLHKIATEGPCRDPQPMALKFSARATWNAWKRVGNITPEDAMEQYIALLSRYVPNWMCDDSCEDGKPDFLATKTTRKIPSCLDKQHGPEMGREFKQLTPCNIEKCPFRAVDPNA